MKRLVVLGATGSVGRSTLAVSARHPEEFKVVAVTAGQSVAALEKAAAACGASRAALASPDALDDRPDLRAAGWTSGPSAILDLARLPGADIVVNAIVGAAGLAPTMAALKAGKRCALANKESLVCGGDIVLDAARRGGGELVPVDSEHSAIQQCIGDARPAEVRRIVLTASGGPFRRASREEMERATAAQAMRHPTWNMGAKITIDSATLANKALEVMEAHYLYGLPYDRIDVVVHPTSIVHSFVEFVDGSVIAQLSEPTMELPILHALTWPRRLADPALCTFDPIRAGPLEFEPVDEARFPLFGLGVAAGRAGGAAPAVFNAANELAVQAFLDAKVTFGGMALVVSSALDALAGREAGSVEAVLDADAAARRRAAAAIRAAAA